MEKGNKRKLLKLVGVLLVLVAIIEVSFAYFLVNLNGTKKYVLTVNSLRIYLDESKNVGDIVSGSKNIPVTDKEGKETTPYLFSIVNEENFPVTYTIYLDEDDDSTTPIYGLRYNLTMNEESIDKTEGIEDLGTKGNRVLHSTTIPGNTTYNYTLKIWLGLNAGNDCKGTKYSGHLRIEGEQNGEVYQDTVLNGTDPVLTDNLIPVKIESDGVVRRASLYDEWYNYENKLWANAIVLEDKTKEVKVEEVIPESDIQSYFVWIPKYSYQLWNLEEYSSITNMDSSKIHTIPIRFGTENTTDAKEGECTTPTSGNGNCKVYDYMTHPAFLSFDSTGFWVGKFESGYKGATSIETAQVNSSDSTKLQIKPDVYSWRNITVGNAFKVSYDYLRNDESHMMKNTEWGAVAYLQHSEYGSSVNVEINNNNAYKTGYASVISPTLGYNAGASIPGNLNGTTPDVTLSYNTKFGYKASTTGNITGIYDMSGGAWEYVTGYNIDANTVGGSSELTSIYGDFFTNSRWEKYYDQYSNAEVDASKYQTGLLGDATREMGPFGTVKDPDGSSRYRTSWYGDLAHFVYPVNPWFGRGGVWIYGVASGVFAFGSSSGRVSTIFSFRVVLTP